LGLSLFDTFVSYSSALSAFSAVKEKGFTAEGAEYAKGGGVGYGPLIMDVFAFILLGVLCGKKIILDSH